MAVSGRESEQYMCVYDVSCSMCVYFNVWVCVCVCRRAKVVPELSKELESPNVDLEAQLHNVYGQEHLIDQHQPPLCVYVFVCLCAS